MQQKQEMVVAHITTIAMSQRYLLFNQLNSIAAAGYTVTAVSSPGEDAAYLEAHGIKHFAVSMTRRITPVADLISLWRLYRLMQQENFIIVHTHNPKPGLLGQIAARMAGVPIVVNTIHGFYFSSFSHPLKTSVLLFIEKFAARFSDLIWSQNQEDMRTALAMGITSPHKIKHLGNGIDINRFNLAKIDADELAVRRAEFGFSTDDRVVGFVGRLVTEKGVHELMQAACLILEQQPDVRFLIVGATDSEKNDAVTPDIVLDYGIAKNCVFTGFRQDMPELYALMDLFVLPSHREGLPRAPMEASAMQTPCVVTDIRGCREVVEHGRNGLLVPPGSVEALADAIIELLTDKEKARRMGEAGRKMAEACFDERRVFDKVLNEYARLLREKGLPVPSATD